MPRANTSIDLKGIANVLAGNRLEVPVYQRPFEWTGEVNEMLADIGQAFSSRNREDYFLGSLVIISGNEKERDKVLDGQQRLAVMALLLSGIANEFKKREDEKRASALTSQYLLKFDIKSGQVFPQLKLNQIDDPYFRSLLQGKIEEPSEEAPDSHWRLWWAYESVKEWIDKKLKKEGDPINWLSELTNYLSESAYVVYFIVSDDANAFLIFETMNDRGLDLSIADLLKNYLLGHSGEDIKEVLNLWTVSWGALLAYSGETLFSTFLRHFWSSKYGLTRERELYRSIKERVSTPANVVDFVKELSRNSFYYGAIMSPEHEFWSDLKSTAREQIHILDTLGLIQYRPMLLAVLAHLLPDDIEKVIRLLISWNVRLLIVGGLGGGVMEGYYSDLGRKISSGEIKTVSDIAGSAKEFIPSDAIFRERFEAARVSKVALARYYLRALERQVSGKDQPELIPNTDPTELNLEHILPQRNPDESWNELFDQEEANAFTSRIGNMVLLSQKINSKLRSASFEEKRKVYEKSELNLTREVAEFDSWDKEAIENRQKSLAGIAVKTWKLEI
jgi:hypothetical protein